MAALKHPKIMKQLQNCRSRELAAKIWQYFYDKMYNNYEKLLQLSKVSNGWHREPEKVREMISAIRISVMDVYFVGRLFRGQYADVFEKFGFRSMYSDTNVPDYTKYEKYTVGFQCLDIAPYEPLRWIAYDKSHKLETTAANN